MRSILITGASGFVGRHLVAALRLAMPDAVLATQRFDIADAAACVAAVRDAAPDACVHLAGITSVAGAASDPNHAWRVNLHGTLNLAHAVLAHAPGCRFLFVSTSEAYGKSFQAGEALPETAALAPMNDYAVTKAAADLAVGALVPAGLRAVRMRPFNHTGRGQSDRFVVPAFARQLAEIEVGSRPPVLRVGALEPRRDFLDVRDVVAAYLAYLSHDDPALPAGAILNLASGTPRRIGDILRDMCHLAGLDVAVEVDATRLRPVEIPVACGDASRARALLRWVPTIPWEDTLRDVLDDWRGRVADTSR